MPWDFLSLLSFTQILKRCISWRCFHLDCIYCILQRGCKESVPGCWLVLLLSCYFWSWRSLNIHMSFDLWKLQERCWNWLGRNLYEVTKWISTFSFCPALNEAFCGSLGESIIVQSSIVPTPTLCNKFYYLSCLFFFRWPTAHVQLLWWEGLNRSPPRTMPILTPAFALAVLTRGYCKRQTLGWEGLDTRIAQSQVYM